MSGAVGKPEHPRMRDLRWAKQWTGPALTAAAPPPSVQRGFAVGRPAAAPREVLPGASPRPPDANSGRMALPSLWKAEAGGLLSV